MHIAIQENGCQDDEIKILDTRLPYFYERLRDMFIQEPSEVNIVLVDSTEEFSQLYGEATDAGAFLKGNTIYIYKPSQFGIATRVQRENFYRTLYQELIYLFYMTNKNN